jgi:hypothetical protein
MLGLIQAQSSPVVSWARPYPKDQSSSATRLVEVRTSISEGSSLSGRTGDAGNHLAVRRGNWVRMLSVGARPYSFSCRRDPSVPVRYK